MAPRNFSFKGLPLLRKQLGPTEDVHLSFYLLFSSHVGFIGIIRYEMVKQEKSNERVTNKRLILSTAIWSSFNNWKIDWIWISQRSSSLSGQIWPSCEDHNKQIILGLSKFSLLVSESQHVEKIVGNPYLSIVDGDINPKGKELINLQGRVRPDTFWHVVNYIGISLVRIS